MKRAFGIIVAGGEGLRMNAGVRKQYLMLSGLPILTRTIRTFAASADIAEIVLVVPEADFAYCRQHVLAAHASGKPVHLIAGGPHRQASVRNGLAAVSEAEATVLIHDGVRPFVSSKHIRECVDMAEKKGACSLGLPVSDTVKQVAASGEVEHTLDRHALWLAQTPQAFDLTEICRAHAEAQKTGFCGTDDASLIERCGGRVHMIAGSPWNVKITTPADLKLAELILQCGLFRD